MTPENLCRLLERYRIEPYAWEATRPAGVVDGETTKVSRNKRTEELLFILAVVFRDLVQAVAGEAGFLSRCPFGSRVNSGAVDDG